MLMRPVDATGDILPVLSASDLLSGPEAVTALVRDRLNLLAGEWWENRSHGCGIMDFFRSGRMTETDLPAVSSYLTSYILSTPGVRSVEDVHTALSGREFSFSCRVVTDASSGTIQYHVDI